MIFKNVELFNIGALIPAEGGGYHMARVPADVRAAMSKNGQGPAICPAGGEIRFVINSGTAKIKLKSNNHRKLVVNYGGCHRGADPTVDFYGPEETLVEIAPPSCIESVRKLTELCGYSYSPNVIRLMLDPFGHDVIVDVEGDIRPPHLDEVPSKRFIMYGSSITHGCFAMAQNNSYVYQLARRLGYDAYNLGFGGSCMLEKEVCDYIAEQGTERNSRTWDFAVMELGINTLSEMDDAEFSRRASYLLNVMTEKNPAKKLFVTDCYFHLGELCDNGKTEARREALRRCIAGRENVIFTSGTELFSDPHGLSADGVHPNVDGVSEIADSWFNVIKPYVI